MEEEIWKNYVADDRVKGLFLISNYGNVLSTRSNKILKPSISNGYFCVATKVGGRSGKCVTIKINRMVAQTFLEPPSQELIDICSKQSHGKVLVLHNDSNKQNNYYKNLRWGSSKDNTQDFMNSSAYISYYNKLCNTKRKKRILSLAQIEEIKKLYYIEKLTYNKLAYKYNVSTCTIAKSLGKSYPSENKNKCFLQTN